MDEMNAAELPQELPAPIETNADISDSSAHAFAQRQEEMARARTNGKPPSIRDSLKNAEKAVSERARTETVAKALGKDLADLKPTERKNLMDYLREKPANLSDEEKEARSKVLAELKKLEPKRDKPETSVQGEDRRRDAVERAFKAHDGQLNKADLSTTEQRQYRAEIKARWPDKKLSDVLSFFEKWHERLAADPHNAWMDLANEYAMYTAPQNDRKGKEDRAGKSVADSLRRAGDDVSDIADMAEWIKKYGAQTPELIRRANEWDQALRADPFGAASRLAANLGGLRNPPQQMQQPQQQMQQHDPRLIPPRSYEEAVSNIERGLDMFIQQEAPDFDQYGHEIAEVITSGVYSHHDNHTAVRLAYKLVKARAAQRMARPAKSVAGGAPPSMQATRGPSKSIRGSIERAMGRL